MRKVVLTHFAISQIELIFDYYKENVSLKIANKIKSGIVVCIKNLKDKNVDCEVDEFLIYLNKNHKRFVCGHYKIIYYVDQNQLFVTDIFDSRQNPIKEKG